LLPVLTMVLLCQQAGRCKAEPYQDQPGYQFMMSPVHKVFLAAQAHPLAGDCALLTNYFSVTTAKIMPDRHSIGLSLFFKWLR
jgi:hypothetical protein